MGLSFDDLIPQKPPVQQLFDPNPNQPLPANLHEMVNQQPMGVSFDDLMPSQHTPAVPSSTAPSFALQGQPAQSFGDEMLANAKAGWGALGDLADNNVNTGLSPRTKILADKLIGNTNGGLSDIAGKALINRMMGSYNDAMGKLNNEATLSDVTGSIEEKMAQSAPGKALQAIGGLSPANLIGVAVNRYVNPAIESATGMSPENLQMAEMLMGTKGGANAARNIATDSISPFRANSTLPQDLANVIDRVIPPTSKSYDPMASMQTMAKGYDDTVGASGKLYDTVSDVAAGQPVNAGKLADHIDGLISEISSNPADPANASLGKLKALRDKLDAASSTTIAKTATGDLPIQNVRESEPFDLKDAVDLKKTLNESFRDNKWKQSPKGSTFANVGQGVDEMITQASRTNPEFAQAYDKAHRFWLNNVENKYRTDVLKPFFQPEDARNIEAVGPNGYADAIAPETVERAKMGPSKIRNSTELEAMAKILDPEQAKVLGANVLKRQPSGGRAQALGKALAGAIRTPLHPFAGPREALSGLGEFIGGPEITPEQAALIKAAKQLKRGK